MAYSYDYLRARNKYLEEALDEFRDVYPKIVDEVLDLAHKKARGHAGGVAYPRDRHKTEGEPLYRLIFNTLVDLGVRGDVADAAAEQVCQQLKESHDGVPPVPIEMTEAIEVLEHLKAGDTAGPARLLRERLVDVLEGSIFELNASNVRDLPDDEVLNLHRRTHQLWGLKTNEHVVEISKETIANAHALLKNEMDRRGMNHHTTDSLDEVSQKLEADVRDSIPKLPVKVLVPEYVSVVGSSVDDYDGADDVDIVIRDDERDENIEVQLRKALDTSKELHYIYHPAGPHDDYLPLYDLVLRPCRDLTTRKITQEAIKPGSRYEVMKPAMTGITDAYSVAELEPWFEKHSKKNDIFASPKIDGLRAVISNNGGIDVWFEDAQESKVPAGLPDLSGSFVIEGEYTAKKGRRWLSRVELAGSIKDTNIKPVFHLYDLLYVDGEDVSDQPFSQRLKRLKALDLPEDHFEILPQRKIGSVSALKKAVKWAFGYSPLAEGIFLREDVPYKFGSTSTAAKLKAGLELKVEVLDVIKTENGYVYRAGLREPGDYENKTKDGKFADLGKTFVTKDKVADTGDTLNVLIEELGESKNEIYWGKPSVQGVDRSRPAYTVKQAIDMAKRRGVWKTTVTEAGRWLRALEAETDDVGITKTEYWEKHWYEALPASGKGKFTLQAHWRGLSEEQTELSYDELTETGHSLHFDIRQTAKGGDLWGITVFAGKAEENDPPRIFDKSDTMRGTFKLAQPKSWLTIARDKPLIKKPGEVGSTSKTWSKFIELDHGTYELGVCRRHSLELFYDGDKLKGRILMTYAPGGDGRVWYLRHSDAKPIAQRYDKEKILEELRKKNQDYLYWNDPEDDKKPELIKVKD